MDLFDWGGRAFRARLKRELPQWRQEGLVDDETVARLHARYQLDEEGASMAAAAIYTLGALLIGGGIISFVAWNWESLSRTLKLLVIGGAMLAAHGAGYWLWRIDGRLPRLGHALVLLGTLIFGANIGLVAQIFHISSDPSRGVGAWAVGAAVAGWALLSAPNAAVAAGLTLVWSILHMGEHESLHWLMPYAVTVPFLPLAWKKRSRPLFAVCTLAFFIAAGFAAAIEGSEGVAFVAGVLAAAALSLAFAFCWRAGTTGWSFRGIATGLGMLAAVATAYACSFHDVAEEFQFKQLAGETWSWLGYALPALAAAAIGFVVGLVRRPEQLRERPASAAALFGIPVLWLCMATSASGGAIAAVANVMLLAVSITAITSAVRNLERRAFWYGSVLAGTVIFSRFLEFDTELWLKAIVFTACGVGVITFGLTFERRLKEAVRG